MKIHRWYLLVVLLLLLAACGGGGNGGSNTSTGSGSEAPESGAGGPSSESVTIQVGNELAYDPAVIEVGANSNVEFTMENTGALEHNLVWDDEASGDPFLHTNPGETASASRTFSEAGTYGFYCSIPGHREAGMEGEVVVSE